MRSRHWAICALISCFVGFAEASHADEWTSDDQSGGALPASPLVDTGYAAQRQVLDRQAVALGERAGALRAATDRAAARLNAFRAQASPMGLEATLLDDEIEQYRTLSAQIAEQQTQVEAARRSLAAAPVRALRSLAQRIRNAGFQLRRTVAIADARPAAFSYVRDWSGGKTVDTLSTVFGISWAPKTFYFGGVPCCERTALSPTLYVGGDLVISDSKKAEEDNNWQVGGGFQLTHSFTDSPRKHKVSRRSVRLWAQGAGLYQWGRDGDFRTFTGFLQVKPTVGAVAAGYRYGILRKGSAFTLVWQPGIGIRYENVLENQKTPAAEGDRLYGLASVEAKLYMDALGRLMGLEDAAHPFVSVLWEGFARFDASGTKGRYTVVLAVPFASDKLAPTFQVTYRDGVDPVTLEDNVKRLAIELGIRI